MDLVRYIVRVPLHAHKSLGACIQPYIHTSMRTNNHNMYATIVHTYKQPLNAPSVPKNRHTTMIHTWIQ